MFLFTRWQSRGRKGFAPSLPENDGFSVLVSGHGKGTWLLCRVRLRGPLSARQQRRPVSSETEALIVAAEECPAVMALTGNAISRLPDMPDDVATLENLICRLLRWFLDQYHLGAFLRAKSKIDEGGYRDEG